MHFASTYRWLVYQYLFASDNFGLSKSSSSSILDIGCDDGGFISHFDSILCIGIDTWSTYDSHRIPGINYVVASASSIPFASEAFEYVIISDVIEHINNDNLAIEAALNTVAIGGHLWLSTTAAHFTIGPEWITRRAESGWGHVRRGYYPETIKRYFNDRFDYTLVLWDEPFLRKLFVLMWIISKQSMLLSNMIATRCFTADVRHQQISTKARNSLQGHIYLSACKISTVTL